MDARDPIRVKLTEQLLEKLYNMGVIPGKTSLSLCDKLSTSSFCRCDPAALPHAPLMRFRSEARALLAQPLPELLLPALPPPRAAAASPSSW